MNLFSTGGIFSCFSRNHADISHEHDFSGYITETNASSYNITDQGTTGKEKKSIWGRIITKIRQAFSSFDSKNSKITLTAYTKTSNDFLIQKQAVIKSTH